MNIKNARYLFMIIVFGFAGVSFVKTTLNLLDSSSRLDNLREEVLSLNSERDDLLAQIEFQKSDEYIEQEARNKLNLIRPGDRVYVVNEEIFSATSDKPRGSSNSTSSAGANSSNIRKWLELLF